MPFRLLQPEKPDDRRAFEELLDRLRRASTGQGEAADLVADIISQVQRDGDSALVPFMKRFTRPNATTDDIRVDPADLRRAADSLDPTLRDAFAHAIENVRAYQRHILPNDPPRITIDDAELGLRFTPIRRVGLTVPGGRASYPSTLIMSAVPAQVAGVSEIVVCCPPPTIDPDDPDAKPGEVSPLVLGLCHMLGIRDVFRVGGAEAVAAMAYGTRTIRPVDFIAGPGTFSQIAKRQVFGIVGIDGLFGPSEIVVLADESANPHWIAADLLAQAEHDPGCCFLVATDRAIIEAVRHAIEDQLPQRRRRDAIEKALRQWSAALLVPDIETACEFVDEIAAEHVLLAVRDPHDMLRQLRNGGAWFLGDGSPVPSGDYYAGPSHCLPTGTTARFTSGLSVYTFLKRSSIEHYGDRPSNRAIGHIAAMAEAEGLDAHAHALRVRQTHPRQHD